MVTAANQADGIGINDRVLLIDMENAVGSIRPRAAVVRARVTALRAAAGDVHHVVACYSAADPAAGEMVSVLAELGVAPWPVLPGRDAAETALLQHAHYVAGRGGRTFLVASGDHRFAELQQLGRLEVLAWNDQKLARKLTTAATQVHRIPKPDVAAADPAAQQPTGPPAAAPQPVEPTQLPTPNRDPDPDTTGHDRHRPYDRQDLSARLLAAVLTGLGIGIGQRLADLLLPGPARSAGPAPD
jgi:hypothetical protein